MSENYKFYQHGECEYFPCHHVPKHESFAFNCMFCYCLLYHLEDCGGNYTIRYDGVKDCINCLLPHKKENYDYIINKLKGGD